MAYITFNTKILKFMNKDVCDFQVIPFPFIPLIRKFVSFLIPRKYT